MGERLVQIYDIVTEHCGYDGRMRLAVQTGITRSKALEIDDTPERIDHFKKEASEILKRNIDEFMP